MSRSHDGTDETWADKIRIAINLLEDSKTFADPPTVETLLHFIEAAQDDLGDINTMALENALDILRTIVRLGEDESLIEKNLPMLYLRAKMTLDKLDP